MNDSQKRQAKLAELGNSASLASLFSAMSSVEPPLTRDEFSSALRSVRIKLHGGFPDASGPESED